MLIYECSGHPVVDESGYTVLLAMINGCIRANEKADNFQYRNIMCSGKNILARRFYIWPFLEFQRLFESMERLIDDKDTMARIILQPSRIGMTVPMVASKINLLSDFFMRIIKDYNLNVMDSIQFNGQMISLDFIQHQIRHDASLKQQVKNHYNPKIQPLSGNSPLQTSLKTFFEQADIYFQSIPAACFFGFEEINITLPENDLHMIPYRYRIGNCLTLLTDDSRPDPIGTGSFGKVYQIHWNQGDSKAMKIIRSRQNTIKVGTNFISERCGLVAV